MQFPKLTRNMNGHAWSATPTRVLWLRSSIPKSGWSMVTWIALKSSPRKLRRRILFAVSKVLSHSFNAFNCQVFFFSLISISGNS